MSDYYEELRAQSGEEAALVDGWRHHLEQWLRFEVVCRGLQLSKDSSIVDVGCGTGRFFEYLKPQRYVGVDRRAEVLERARDEFSGPEAKFLNADWGDEVVDDAGPFDFAVAIGTMVDGAKSNATERRHQLGELMSRLNELGTSGWALVALDQARLEADPVRSLEPYLKGARKEEVNSVLGDLDVDAAVEREVIPTDLVVIYCRGDDPSMIAQRISGDGAHETVLARASINGDIDKARKVWFWMNTGRLDRARKVLEEMPDSHLRKRLLSEQLRLRGG